jgi:hypothetical protein
MLPGISESLVSSIGLCRLSSSSRGDECIDVVVIAAQVCPRLTWTIPFHGSVLMRILVITGPAKEGFIDCGVVEHSVLEVKLLFFAELPTSGIRTFLDRYRSARKRQRLTRNQRARSASEILAICGSGYYRLSCAVRPALTFAAAAGADCWRRSASDCTLHARHSHRLSESLPHWCRSVSREDARQRRHIQRRETSRQPQTTRNEETRSALEVA